MKTSVIPVELGAQGVGMRPPKLGEWLQQIPGPTSETLVQKGAVLRTVKICGTKPKFPFIL